jgi:hypothetical protein
MARISNKFAIEIDGYPETATIRPHHYGELPPSVAIVGFEVDSFNGLESLMVTPAQSISAFPYGGSRVAVVRRTAGELIELIRAE